MGVNSLPSLHPLMVNRGLDHPLVHRTQHLQQEFPLQELPLQKPLQNQGLQGFLPLS